MEFILPKLLLPDYCPPVHKEGDLDMEPSRLGPRAPLQGKEEAVSCQKTCCFECKGKRRCGAGRGFGEPEIGTGFYPVAIVCSFSKGSKHCKRMAKAGHECKRFERRPKRRKR